MMRVILAVVTDTGTCSLGFVASMVRLQAALMTVPQLSAAVCVVGSVAEAAALAAREGNFDAVVALTSTVTFPVALVTRALVAPAHFVCGVYPLPSGIDWQRVQTATDEEARFRGNTYSIDPAAARVVGRGYAEVDRAGLGAAVLHRPAFQAVAAAGCRTDDDVCAAWGRPILADLDHPCAAMGPVEFSGCAARRLPNQNFVSDTCTGGA